MQEYARDDTAAAGTDVTCGLPAETRRSDLAMQEDRNGPVDHDGRVSLRRVASVSLPCRFVVDKLRDS